MANRMVYPGLIDLARLVTKVAKEHPEAIETINQIMEELDSSTEPQPKSTRSSRKKARPKKK